MGIQLSYAPVNTHFSTIFSEINIQWLYFYEFVNIQSLTVYWVYYYIFCPIKILFCHILFNFYLLWIFLKESITCSSHNRSSQELYISFCMFKYIRLSIMFIFLKDVCDGDFYTSVPIWTGLVFLNSCLSGLSPHPYPENVFCLCVLSYFLDPTFPSFLL